MEPARIYLDNAATSWPKPESVYAAVDRYQRELGAPAGRSGYREAGEANRLVENCRSRIARLLGVADPRRVIFTASGTDSLNLALYGALRPGDHVVTTVAEHNSVLRPLRHLEAGRQIAVTRVGCRDQGTVDPDDIRRALQPRTKLVVVTHASNVTGAVQPVPEIGAITSRHGIMLLVDAAQTLGHLPIHVDDLNIDLLAAPGHKALLGPLGTGILYVRPGLEERLDSLRQGGTGTRSESDRQPDSLPEKFEAGNLNVPGIAGLGAAVGYLEERGVEAIGSHASALTRRLLAGFEGLAGLTVYGARSGAPGVGVVSVNLAGYDPQELAAMLDAHYRIQVRAGLHCAPLMHEAIGTLTTGGTVRFACGAFNTIEDVEMALLALREFAAASLIA